MKKIKNSNAGLIRPFSNEFASLCRFLDSLIIFLSLQLVCYLLNTQHIFKYLFLSLISVIFFFFIAELRSIYQSSRLESYGNIAGKILTTWIAVGLSLIFLIFSTKSSEIFSRFTIFSWLVLTPSLLICERFVIYFLLHYWRGRGKNTRTYAIMGDEESAEKLFNKINSLSWTGLTHFRNYFDLGELKKDVNLNKIDYVFLSYPLDRKTDITNAVNALGDSTVSVYLVPDIFLSDLLGSHWIVLGNMPLIPIHNDPTHNNYWLVKKIEDMILGTLILALILIPMLLIAIGVKLSSPGPILFKQRRYGLNGEIILVLKFRTMSTKDDGEDVIQAKKNDPRVTAFGRVLRKTSLDELPQFINVLQGNMSIVGPRPHAVSHNEHYRKLISGYMQRHKVKPGITGWAQVNGLRGETETLDKMKDRVELDLYYINHWSIWLDLKIIYMTLTSGFISKTAY
jgi:putative colanic acid biosynthesis UDP-glucose lipid carrier transferase